MVQDKNKYNTPRYRLVARFTNKDIVAQVVKANITGDEVRTWNLPTGIAGRSASRRGFAPPGARGPSNLLSAPP